jgi:hypothetical protein
VLYFDPSDKSPKCKVCFEDRNTTDKLNLEAGKSKPTPMCEIGIEDHRTLLGLSRRWCQAYHEGLDARIDHFIRWPTAYDNRHNISEDK